ncbi:MAG: hypothetical protein WCH91_00385 [bacterium]|jgi:hypothetical protein
MERASDSLSGWVRRAGPSLPVERYLAELDAVLEGQADTSLAVDGIDAPLSGVARAVIVESIGADLEAAARDLMLAGVPRGQAEMRAISDLGPAPDLGRALLGARRRQTVMAVEMSDDPWSWTEPLLQVLLLVVAIGVGALAPVLAVIIAIVVERQSGVIAVMLVPVLTAVLGWAAGAVAPPMGHGNPAR